jgi:hypothetical protein
MIFPSRRATALAGAALCLAAAGGAVASPAAIAAPSSPAPGWHIARVVSEKYDADLLTLAAVSKTDAWAFGQNSSGRAAALRWNGSAWKGAALPKGLSRPAYVSATGPDNVWAGGSECIGGPPGPDVFEAYVTRWNGHRWRTSRWKTAAYCGAAMVTTGPRNGWLIGDEQALHFTGRSWQKVSLGNVGQAQSAVAVSADNIWVFTERYNEQHPARSKTFFLHWNGQRWDTVRLPALTLPKGGSIYPLDMAQAGPRSIWAIANVTPGNSIPLLLHYNGSAWRSVRVPYPGQQLLAVTPDGRGGVWATMMGPLSGNYSIVHYLGGKWTSQPVPTAGLPGLTGNPGFDLYAISLVPGTRDVLATGDTFYSTPTNANVSYSLIFSYSS